MTRKKYIKPVLILSSLLLIITAVVGGTIAYLHTNTEEVVNIFEPTKVPIKVEETFDGKTKSNVTIKNVGTTSAYIRAKIVVNWIDENGDIVVGDVLPTVEEITKEKSNKWVLVGDYFYYKEVVIADASTENLINTFTYQKEEGKPNLQIEILAQSVQSVPEKAIKDLWGVTIANGNVTTVTP